MRIRITVVELDGKYYASRHSPTMKMVTVDAKIVFTIDAEENEELESLEERARQEARKRGIAHVISLD